MPKPERKAGRPLVSRFVESSRDKVIEELWRRGELSFLLYEHQIPVYDAIKKAMANYDLKYVLNCARRFGKSTILVIIALEEAIKTGRHQIRFAAPTGKDLKKAIYPIMMEMTQTCPDDLMPVFNSQDSSFNFKNGSGIHLAGVNGMQADNLRGSVSHLNIIDEAGSIDDLKYLIQSVLIPQTLTTDGLTIIASTPSLSPDHEYYQYYQQAMADGKLSEFTIHDNTSLSPEKIDEIMKDNGGAANTTWRREYLCEFCVDSDLNIVPEWKKEYISKYGGDEYDNFYHKYLSMDLGVVDKTLILYGIYNFKESTMYIQSEDDISGNDMTTELIYNKISVKENTLWGTQPVYKRISDNNNPLLLQDLSKMYSLFIRPTNKDTLEAMINEVRIFVKQGRLKVDPSCSQLIGCLNNGIWKKTQKGREFARSTAYGHYDALAALVYLIRNLDTHTNPIPVQYNFAPQDGFIVNTINDNSGGESAVEIFKKVFKIGK